MSWTLLSALVQVTLVPGFTTAVWGLNSKLAMRISPGWPGGVSAFLSPSPPPPPPAGRRAAASPGHDLVGGRVGRLDRPLGVVAGPDQRTGLDVGEAETLGVGAESGELVGVPPAGHRQVQLRRSQVLPDGE